jgi:hypothetical protein
MGFIPLPVSQKLSAYYRSNGDVEPYVRQQISNYNAEQKRYTNRMKNMFRMSRVESQRDKIMREVINAVYQIDFAEPKMYEDEKHRQFMRLTDLLDTIPIDQM